MMLTLRWLLTMDTIPDARGTHPAFRLCLVELDQEETPQPFIFQTVDELYGALVARWEGANHLSETLLLAAIVD
jgi:hypothetical protein